MFERQFHASAPNILMFRIDGPLTEREQAEIGKVITRNVSRYGGIRLVLFMDYLQTTDSAESLYEDLRFAKQYAAGIDRMAVVGQTAGQGTWVGLFGLFGGVDAVYFDRFEAEKAFEWIQQSPSG